MDIEIINSEFTDLDQQDLNLNIITHNGVFHSDEVFASALLMRLFHYKGSVNIVRTRNKNIIDDAKKSMNVFVVDVGGAFNPLMLNFDHHQDGGEVENKASVLLVLDYLYKSHFVDGALYDYLKSNLIQFVSDWDLGLEQGVANYNQKPLPTLISAFNRYNAEPTVENNQFHKALQWAIEIVDNEMDAFKQLKLAKEGLKRHIALSKQVVMFDNYNPQYSKLLKHCAGVKYYIHSLNNNWVVKTINNDLYPLPIVLDKSELVFAHKSRFMTIFNNKQAAIEYIMKSH